MSRTPFRMSDEQAARLLMLVPPLRDKHPAGGPSNRPFVHDFIKAVHTATGRTFSPAIYRRLLDTYAPDRKPSTNTLALEKEAVERELASASKVPSPYAPPAPGLSMQPHEVANLVRDALEDVLARQLRVASDSTRADQQMAQNYIADLSNRLAASDKALAEARGHAARLAAELQVTMEREANTGRRLQELEATVQRQREAQAAELSAVTAELAEIRKFAMRSIDDVRGETRAERERRAQLEEQLRKSERLMEVFRQAAYQRGGSIPNELRMEPPR